MLSTFMSSNVECLSIYDCYMFLMNWPLCNYTVTLLVTCYHRWLKICLVWYKYSYPYSILFSICLEYLFPSFYLLLFMSLKLKWFFCVQLGLIFTSIQWTYVLIGEFSLFIIKVIIKLGLTIAFLLIVVSLFCTSFLPLLLLLFVIWWFSLVIHFVSCLLIFCVFIIGFCFVVTMKLAWDIS